MAVAVDTLTGVRASTRTYFYFWMALLCAATAFGGFTPTYVDLVALFTVRAGAGRLEHRWRSWLATMNMRIDYFEPIVGPQFVIESRLVKTRGRTNFVETRFFDPADTLAVFALTTLREVSLDRPLGDV